MNEEELRDPDTIPLQDALLDAFCEVRLMERGILRPSAESWEDFCKRLKREAEEEEKAAMSG